MSIPCLWNSLYNDLKALRVVHARVIDIAIVSTEISFGKTYCSHTHRRHRNPAPSALQLSQGCDNLTRACAAQRMPEGSGNGNILASQHRDLQQLQQ
jgi:hypothetical protein